jgi:hypothetical protein
MAGGAVFKLGSFGNFHVFKKGAIGHRGADPPSPGLRRDRGFAPVRGDDGNDRSFITRDFNSGLGK